ncbi:hypothetical protein FRB94_014093 [Tulasnella sp. JGI-2019a]|nr:hypothetical protein FRB93_013111 [Tulasnella sp. JGI-2019a]KAG9007671.1 hypothetical protein FRB94_014093 [Tulasnella sp. JGI-2019a]
MAAGASAPTTTNGCSGDYVAFERKTRPEYNYEGDGKASQGLTGNMATNHSNNSMMHWDDKVDWYNCNSAAEMPQCEIEASVDWMSPQKEEHELRNLVVEHIRRAVRTAYPRAEVTAFGSYTTALYLPSDGLDLVLTIPPVADPLKVLFRLPTLSLEMELARRSLSSPKPEFQSSNSPH